MPRRPVRRLAGVLLVLLISLLGARPAPDRGPLSDYVRAYLAVEESVVALVGATVIDGTGAPPERNRTVVLRDGRIAAVGPVATTPVPADARVIDAAGRTVIPGIVGTHNHTHMPGAPALHFTAPRLYLAAGVTTIQTTGSAAPYAERNLARAVARGDVPGPDVLHTGPYISGEGGSPVMIVPEGPEHVERVVRYWVGEGVTWFKAYRHIAPEHLRLLIDAAHRHGAKVTGHLCTVTYAEAAAMGIDAVEHGFLHASDHIPNRAPGTCAGSRAFRDTLAIDGEAVRRVQRAMIDAGVALTSTLAIFEAQTPGRPGADARTLAALAPHLVDAYHDRRARMAARGDDWHFRPAWLARSMAYDLAYFRAGGLLTAGLDPGLHNLPGYGDARNLELLVEGGFTVAEAVQVMTSNGARLLERPDVGTVAVGRRADLVVLRGDLAAYPSRIHDVEVVFKDGYGYDPARLVADVAGQVGYR